MRQKFLVLVFILCGFSSLHAQKDTTGLAIDTTVDYDALFSELDNFLDSLMTPRSFTLLNVSAGTSLFNNTTSSSSTLTTEREFMVIPSAGYFDKSGWGFNTSVLIRKSSEGWNPYQLSTTLSYDYVKKFAFVTGISASHFFTKDSLPFYTSPLKNELVTYFSYRKLWVRPTLSVSYGWGSRSEQTERQEYINLLRMRPRGYTRTNIRESISDFNIMLSVRHDFYRLNVFTKKDFVRISPQLNFTSGTQSYGFNQTSSTYGPQRITGNNVLFRSENIYLDESTRFRPLSLAAALKSELSVGKFFLQPQLICNYYIPATEKNFTTSFVVNTGFIL